MLFSIFFFLVGFGITFLGFRSLIKVWYLERKGIRTVGRIIGISDTDNESDTLPIIEYVTLSGEVMQKKSNIYYYRVHLGQEIPLIYNERYPYQMIHDSFSQKYSSCIFLLLLGLAFMTVPTWLQEQS